MMLIEGRIRVSTENVVPYIIGLRKVCFRSVNRSGEKEVQVQVQVQVQAQVQVASTRSG